MDQQDDADGVEATLIAADSTPTEEMPIPKVLSTLAVFALLPMVLLMWFGIYLDFIPLSVLYPLVLIVTLVVVWRQLDIGLPTSAGGTGVHATRAVIVVGAYVVMLASPLILGNILVGEM